MATGGVDAARRPAGRRLGVLSEDVRSRALRADELAWIAVVPCGILVVAAIVLLGPPLGQLLFPGSDVTFWPVIERAYIPPEPESTEHARYLLALAAPLLLAGFILYGTRRADRLEPVTIRSLVIGSQVAA